jgi:hypothetical protein
MAGYATPILGMAAFPACKAPRRGGRGAALSNAAAAAQDGPEWPAEKACLSAPAAAQEDPEWTAEKELCTRRGLPYAAAPARGAGADAAGPEHQAAEAAAIPVGARCEADPGAKRGVVRCVRRAARCLHACLVLLAMPPNTACVAPLHLWSTVRPNVPPSLKMWGVKLDDAPTRQLQVPSLE